MTPEQRQLLARLITDTRVQMDLYPAVPASQFGPSVDMTAVHVSPDGSRAVKFLTHRSIPLPEGTSRTTPRAELLALAIQALGDREVRAIASQLNKFETILAEVRP